MIFKSVFLYIFMINILPEINGYKLIISLALHRNNINFMNKIIYSILV